MSDNRILSYQAAYAAAVLTLQRMIKDWPLGYPPNLIICNNAPGPEECRSDPRGCCKIAEMKARIIEYSDPPVYGPISAGVYVYHPNMLKMYKGNYDNNIPFSAVHFDLILSMMHELFHLVGLQRAYARMFEQYEDEDTENFAVNLSINHLENILGSTREECETEHLAISAMLAFIFSRGKIKLKHLYDRTLMLPRIDGMMFQQIRRKMKGDDLPHYAELTMLEIHFHLAEAAWNPDQEKRKYHRYMAEELMDELMKLAKKLGDKLGKTYYLANEDEYK